MPALHIDIEARFAQFQDALTKIERSTQKSAANMSRAFSSVQTTLAGLGVGLSVAAFATVIKGAIDAADHLNDLSQKTGIAVDTLGGLGFAAGQAGGDLESIASAADKLNKSIAGAAGGNKELSKAFAALGINIRDATGELKKADVVMAEIADKFKDFEDGPEKADLARQLLGKSGPDQIALLNEGGDALRENIEYYKRYAGVTQEVAEKADAFNDTVGKIQLMTGALSRTIAADLLPTLQELASSFLSAKENGRDFSTIGSVITEAFKAVVVFGANVIYVLKAFATEVEGIGRQLAALSKLDFKGFKAIGDQMKVDAAQARRDIDAFSQRIMDAGKPKVASSVADFAAMDAVVEKPTARPKTRAPIIPSGGARSGGDDPAKRILDSQLRDLERQSDQERNILSARNEFLQTYYREDLISISDYYDARRKAQDEALQAQTANIDQEIALLRGSKTKDARDAAERDRKVDDLLYKKAGLQAAAGLESVRMFVEQEKAAKEFQSALEDINSTLLEQQGYLAAAAEVQFDRQYGGVERRIGTERQSAAERGDAPTVAALDAEAGKLATLRKLAVARAQLNGLDAAGADIQADLAMATDRAYLAMQSGATTELESLRMVSDARLQAAADLQQVADAFERVAKASNDPTMIRQAQAMQLEVQKLAANADLVREQFEDVFSSGFESFFEKLMTGTASVKDAFKSLVSDIGAQFSRIVSKNLAEQLFSKEGALGGVAGFLSSAFGGKSANASASPGVGDAIAKLAGGATDVASTAAATAATTASTAAVTAFTASIGASSVAVQAAMTSVAASAAAASAALATVTASSAANSAGGVANALAKVAAIAANGHVFNAGNVIPFAKGGVPGIVDAPTFFPMAGGKTGLMGEAGPEAIMPLKRDERGELAVTVVGPRGEVSLLAVTRDRSGRLAVKTDEAFARGAAFEAGAPLKFANGGVIRNGDVRSVYSSHQFQVVDASTNAAAGAQPAQVSQTINFYSTGPVDRRTQQQVAAAAYRGSVTATRRNG